MAYMGQMLLKVLGLSAFQ